MVSTLFGFIYKNCIKKIFFLFDPEKVHDRAIKTGKWIESKPGIQKIIHYFFSYKHKMLEQDILGIHFVNPIGLAAGFDKNAQISNTIGSIGFGFAEVGSITGEKCAGNPLPRLWRLKKSKSLVVYFGLKNDGSEIIAQRLKNKKFNIPVGISIAKTNCKETAETKTGIGDYIKGIKAFEGIGDYITVNISCPNAYGGEPFTDPEKLDQLLQEVDSLGVKKPIFLKLAADLQNHETDAILDIATKHNIQGFICSNLTKNRNNPKIIEKNIPEKGGLSGKVVEDLSNNQIKYIYKKMGKKYIIIGCGGTFSAKDAYKKIQLGASLIQLITGMIFEGPQLIGEINRGLVELLQKDGFTNIGQAVGSHNS